LPDAPGAYALETDPYAFVVSANITRRHLTAEQKRDLIAKLLKRQPETSDRQIGGMIKADNKTVAAVRAEMEGREEIPHVETRTDSKGRKQPAKREPRADETAERAYNDTLKITGIQRPKARKDLEQLAKQVLTGLAQAFTKRADSLRTVVQFRDALPDDIRRQLRNSLRTIQHETGALADQLEDKPPEPTAEQTALQPTDDTDAEQPETAEEEANRESAENATRATKLPKLNPDGVSVAGCKLIYAPAGQAGEYAPLSANPYRGCGHGCAYCYVPDFIRMKRKDFDATATPKPDYLKKLEKDAAKYQALGITEQVMLSFSTDVYNPINSSLTRPVIQILRDHGLGFCVLTKGGSRALADIDLYRRDRDAFASTLTSLDDHFSKKWERNAALPGDRIETLKAFHDRGIFTWVSLEPTLDCDASIEIVRATHSFVDLFKVGRVNHDNKMTKTIDWEDYTHRMIAVLKELGAAHYIKKDLQPYLPPNYPNPLRVPQHHDAASLVAEAA
jgi:hypothetical protein